MIDREQAWNDLCSMPNKVEQLEKENHKLREGLIKRKP
jgi:hypothetical protein